MPIQSEIIYPESIMAHLTPSNFVLSLIRTEPKSGSGVLVMVTYGHNRFFVTVTSRMDIIHDNGLCISAL